MGLPNGLAAKMEQINLEINSFSGNEILVESIANTILHMAVYLTQVERRGRSHKY